MRERVRALREAGVEAVSVCLLHSYLNPAHERRIKEILQEEFPRRHLSVSHEVLPLYREYERFSTVCLNAYIGPRWEVRAALLDAMRSRLRHDVQLMQSTAAPSGRRGGRAARFAPDVRARWPGSSAASGRGRWRARQRDHAGHGRHLGRHRRGARRRATDAPPRRHDRRRLPGDGADGRRRHDRRGRRLDRLRRPRRRLPRRPAVGRRRPGAGLLRPRRQRADVHGRAAPARAASSGRAARRTDAPRPRSGASRRCEKVARRARRRARPRPPRSVSCRSRSSA